MTRRMLVDATHAEETRVVVADGKRLEEFDFETSTKKQLKGNIYLAKVTRVEPSLQAAFVEYGGNRHGFLAFSEIHPDYYRVPVADREKLLADARGDGDNGEDRDDAGGEDPVETLGGDDEDDIKAAGAAERRRVRGLTRRYGIQEVITRRQILLVQVVKEERGTKGAALTTYISLPGRYCVLMPNTTRGGGISRKITDARDRQRLKAVLGELALPSGMAVILRTAGMERSKAEIKRDSEYLRRTWNEIREETLRSTAPTLIHEEGNIIKRVLRDVYSREIEEVIVDGDDAYRTARAFMKTMLPSHVKRIRRYEGKAPLLHEYRIESQLDDIHNPVVQLASGGYVVMNPTEALVAIDVNSGRATRERNIEETALATNLEAAAEIARQLRLRDLAGLIVIDFIDMGEQRHNTTVERRLKEAMRTDRARLQVGRVSPFGLLELSRQRLRPSLIEAHTQVCPTCGGSGVIRSTESTALRVLRALEEEGLRGDRRELTLYVPGAVAPYVLNQKRAALTAIEARHDLEVTVLSDPDMVPPDFRIERIVRDDDGETATVEVVSTGFARPATDAGDGRSRRRRRRRRRDEGDAARGDAARGDAAGSDAAEAAAATATADDRDGDGDTDAGGGDREKSRRGRRGGRRRRRRDEEAPAAAKQEGGDSAADADSSAAEPPGDSAAAGRRRRRPRRRPATRPAASAGETGETGAPAPAGPAEGAEGADGAATARRPERPDRGATVIDITVPAAAPAQDDNAAEPAADGARRRGWWSRLTAPARSADA